MRFHLEFLLGGKLTGGVEYHVFLARAPPMLGGGGGGGVESELVNL